MKKEINLEEHKQILLEITDEIDLFCRKNNIKYFLMGGSLIGAVRHKGFIPWDDDIDIAMLREDYEKFISLFPLDYENSNFELLCPEFNKEYGYGFAKVIDTRTVLEEQVSKREKLGIYVDIFPLDNCTSSLKSASRYLKHTFPLYWARDSKTIKYDRHRSLFKNILLSCGKLATCFVSKRRITNAILKRAKKFKNVECDYVAQMAGNVYGEKDIWEKELFSAVIDAEFEGRHYCIPKEYDKILTRAYGDYMTPPPIEKRTSSHRFIAYWKK